MVMVNHATHSTELLSDFYFGSHTSDYHIAADFINVMYSIYHTDITVNRKSPRHADITVPVSDVELWNSVKEKIENLVHWVSEDYFFFKFIKNSTSQSSLSLLSDSLSGNDGVTLFSGGLDSLAGAYYNYKNNIICDYVGFVNNKEEGKKQDQLRTFYQNTLPNSTIHVIRKQNILKKYHVQSTRSLLYLALATCKALSNSSNKVYLFENGILTLNPELNGRYTTKTTHPRTISSFNSILKDLGVNIEVKNPFNFFTKGEILNNMNSEFKNEIKHTHTCGNSRIHPDKNHIGQCGVCIPCVLRKISIAANDLEPFDVVYHYHYDVKLSEIDEEMYRKDYASNIEYFQEYCKLISEGNIFAHLDLSKNYFTDELNYLEDIYSMLIKFRKEFERFWSKYAPY